MVMKKTCDQPKECHHFKADSFLFPWKLGNISGSRLGQHRQLHFLHCQSHESDEKLTLARKFAQTGDHTAVQDPI